MKFFISIALILSSLPLWADPVISEFLASNSNGLNDENGDTSDWIEIHNPDAVAVNLNGWSLTDDATQMTKWTFPSTPLAPGQRIVVFASGKDRAIAGAELHTNFSLTSNGEYLALVKPGGSIASSSFNPYPAQKTDVSYGISSITTTRVGETTPLKYTLSSPPNDAQGDAWTEDDFDDSSWNSTIPAITSYNSTPNIPIPNVGGDHSITSDINISNLSGTVTDVNVTINIDHTFVGDLEIDLIAPNGARVDLVTHFGGTKENFTNTVFDDNGATLTSTTPAPFTGTFKPESVLSALNGQTPNGVWRLEVKDTAGGDGGIFKSWSLSVTPSISTPVLAKGAIGYDTGLEYPIVTMIPTGTEEVWVRYPFTVTDLTGLNGITLSTQHDDGFQAYINGTLVHSVNVTNPIQAVESNGFIDVDISSQLSALKTGANVLTFRLVNSSANSRDLLLLPKLSTTSTQVGYSYSTTPTPAAANSGHILNGFVGDTKFAVGRGMFNSPFTETITCATLGSTIIYTTDGSTPSLSNGTQVAAPSASAPCVATISIPGTTTLRAAAFLTDHLPSNTDTQSYIFTAQVVNQPLSPTGWPTSPINGQVFDYAMDAPANIGTNAATVQSALESIPSVSLVTDQANLTNSSTGIYTHAGSKGRAWERSASVEMLFPSGYTNPDGNLTGFHSSCGLRIRGGGSRTGSNPKHSFRLFFRSEYGDSKLKYPLFGSKGAPDFNRIDFRTAQNYSWNWANDPTKNTFIRDVYNRDLQASLNLPHTRSRYFHLYLNGVYWGLYMTEERPDSSFGDSYLGGIDDDYDVVKSSGATGGYTTEASSGAVSGGAWETAWNLSKSVRNAAATSNTAYHQLQGLNPDGSLNIALPKYLDPNDLIDYMLIIFYSGSADAPLTLGNGASNNWFGMRNRTTNTHGFQFFVHDTEHSLDAINRTDTTGPYTSDTSAGIERSNPQFMHEYLSQNNEYKLRFADRAHAAFHNTGALTKAKSDALIDARAAVIDSAIIAESARWGDFRNANNPYGRTHWLSAVSGIKSWLTGREATVIGQLKIDGLYPNTDPPSFNQHGGVIPVGFQLTISNPGGQGTVYFTTDGTDPRAIGGAVSGSSYSSAITLNQATVVKARVLNGGEWSALNEAEFTLGETPTSSNLVISEFSYNAAPSTPGGLDGADFDFIEIMNIGTQNVDLTTLSFNDGITFDFSTVSLTQRTLSPGSRAIICEDITAFTARYGSSANILGQWTGALSNGGETLRLGTDSGFTVQLFTYNDKLPWPTCADGDGYSLVLIDPISSPIHNDPASWRCSFSINGRPGLTNSLPAFAGNANDDIDNDGLNALLEHFFGSSDSTPSSQTGLYQTSIVTIDNGVTILDHPAISFRRKLGADDLRYQVEVSTTLESASWETGTSHVVLHQEVHNGDGTVTQTWRSVANTSSTTRLFLRLKVTQP